MEKIEKNFILKKRYLGKGYTIKVLPTKVHRTKFQYNHDELFKSQKERFSEGGSAYYCWNKSGYYTNTKNDPNWAEGYISEIKQ